MTPHSEDWWAVECVTWEGIVKFGGIASDKEDAERGTVWFRNSAYKSARVVRVRVTTIEEGER